MVIDPSVAARAREAAAAAVYGDDKAPGEFSFADAEALDGPPVPERPAKPLDGHTAASPVKRVSGALLPTRQQKDVMVRVDPSVHCQLRAIAASKGQAIGRVARDLLLDALARDRT